MKIHLIAQGCRIDKILTHLKEQRLIDPEDKVNEKRNPTQLAFSHETALITIAALNTIGLIINALLAYIGKNKAGYIRVKGKNGELLVPRGTPQKELEGIVSKIHEIGIVDEITVKID